MPSIRLIVGLGNPGEEYIGTRHNAGADFVSAIARQNGIELSAEKKLAGRLGRGNLAGHDLRLMIPDTHMNHSGKAVGLAAKYFQIAPEHMLIAHDELDMPPGASRFKFDGGHGGHNGLRDIIPAIGGSKAFWRLRVGIGHPGQANRVSAWVLSKASKIEQGLIDLSVEEALRALPLLLDGEDVKAMTRLHSSDKTRQDL
ncbi:MAG: aminoacyl-tRNA hydrolase [Pseudomonadota bacterium]|nr:aminoacyl-tRNA hydrolase [Pseudomonadota bacterium]